MCVIIYKPAGAPAPSEQIIKQCWDTNRDGAGIVIPAADGKHNWLILKGFMKFEEFADAVARHTEESKPAVYHLRIGTSGGNVPANTHPFPVSGKVEHLQALSVFCNEFTAHNGVLPYTPRQADISDTMEFILQHADPEKRRLACYKHSSSNRFALSRGRDIELIGSWHERDGLYFSNLNWEAQNFADYYSSWGNNKRAGAYYEYCDMCGMLEDIEELHYLEDTGEFICPECYCELFEKPTRKRKLFDYFKY